MKILDPKALFHLARNRIEIGISFPLRVRNESVQIAESAFGIKLLYASDLHLNRNNYKLVSAELCEVIEQHAPDILILGGDLVDTRAGIRYLKPVLNALKSYTTKLCAVLGNHDQHAGTQEIESLLVESSFQLLEYTPLLVECSDRKLILTGKLLESCDLPQILCTHDPKIFPSAAQAGAALVLAGHLHGGQAVLFSAAGLYYPGALLSRWTGPRFELSNSTLLVSNGITDSIPLRYNCPREVILCSI